MQVEEGAHIIMMTNFESINLPIIAHGLDLIEQGIITGKTNLEFAKSVLESIEKQYAHFDDQVAHPIQNYGDFFPAVI